MFNGLNSAVGNLAVKVVQLYQARLKQAAKVATSQTISSLRVESISGGGGGVYGFKIFGDKSFDYIEYGRRAGAKLPPKGSLNMWLAAKNIPLSKEYLIRRSVAIKGIKPVPISAYVKLQVQPLIVDLRKDFEFDLLNQNWII